MNRQRKLFAGMFWAWLMWACGGFALHIFAVEVSALEVSNLSRFVLGTSSVSSTEKQDLHTSEGIDRQIEYMVSSVMHVRERMLEQDVTPPEILGLQELVVKVGDTLSYKRGVTVQDNSGVGLELVIDNSQVDLSKLGTYTVYYTATDLSGNITCKEVLVTVIEQEPADPEVVNALADDLIAQLTTEDMTDQEKVYTLFNWCRTKIKYSYSSESRTLYEGAYEGLHDHKGDCYVYYATMEVFLNRLGIDNMKVTRVGGTSNHWWNLVNMGDGWYHLDASPRQKGDPFRCFMQTDEQVAAYSVYYETVNPGHPNYYGFDDTLYPQRGTQVVFESTINPLP